MILEGEKSHDVESVGWRTHKAASCESRSLRSSGPLTVQGYKRRQVSQLQEAGSKSSLPLFPIQALLHRLGDARLGGRSAFLILPTQMLISSRYTLTGTPQKPCKRISGHPVARLVSHVNASHCIRLYCGPHLCLPQGPRLVPVFSTALGSHPPSARFRASCSPHLLWL